MSTDIVNRVARIGDRIVTSLSNAAPAPGGSPRSTMRQVAERAGVSVKTVSRVVNGEPAVAPATLRRVLSAAAALDRPRASTMAAIPAGAAPRSSGASERAVAEERGAGRLKALLADPAVQVLAHRDDASARLVLQVRDRTTGEIIEQYPPEQLRRFYAALRESLGALIDQRA